MNETRLTVGMIYDAFELGNGDTCAFNVYDKQGMKCIWRKTPYTTRLHPDFPELTNEQRELEVLRITTTASAIYLDVDAENYHGAYIRNTGDYY